MGNKMIYIFAGIYVTGLSLFMLWHRAWFSPDQFFVAAIIAVIFLGRFKLFLADWVPFLLLFFSYEYLRGLADIVNKSVHITPMISADKVIFGFIPTIKLQQLLYHPGVVRWYDVAASIL